MVDEIGLRLRIHPRHILDRADWAILRLWQRCRPGGMGGQWLLPFAGGVMDQPACVMASLDAMERAWQAMQPKKN